MDETGKLTVICGHYGSGKTNFAMNYAIDAAKNGNNVTLADMDIVNPYFTSSEYSDVLERNGVKVISPVFARTNMEITALPASMYSIFDTDGDVIIDAGGDDAGATVLGRFAEKIKERGYEMIYVTNMYRPSTSVPEDSVSVLREIEDACGLKATVVVNNSHLKNESTASLITDSLSYGKEVARLARIPLLFTTVPFSLKESMPKDEYFYPVAVYVGTIWERNE
ncbi:MAG: hypothetical protein FWF40_00265 [Methanomassiliicoccaceae archaeon]|nr:hypothetical protein [Methanomassiliicoccaceae archaeon]